MGQSKLTTAEKLAAVQRSPELVKAMGLLIAAYKDCDLKSHIRFRYPIQGKTYEITFLCSENEFATLVDGSVINTLTAPPSVTNNKKTK